MLLPRDFGLKQAPGMISPGNVQLNNRPKVDMGNGQYGTVYTQTITNDKGQTILIPRIYDGKLHSPKEATDHYKQTGQHMGIFKDQKSANSYDEQLHNDEGWIGPNNKWTK